jgi:PAS domain S-box-containing protein
MTKKKTELRKEAEGKVSRFPENLAALSPEETQHLLLELRVHQIELEMQNEELRRAHRELDAARARYFDLYDLAPVGYFTLSEEGLILEANLTAAALLGSAKGILVRQPLTRFILPKDQDLYYRHRKLLFETALPQECELRMVRQDGKTFWARMEATVPRDVDGASECHVTISEITEQKQAEEIRIQNERLSQVLNGLDALVYVIDMITYEIIFINTYGQNIWGDIKGKICWQTIQAGQTGPCEFCTNGKLIGPDGNPTEGVGWEFQNTSDKRWYDCRDRAIYWPDGRIVRMEIATEITRRKEAEQALAAEHHRLGEANTALRVLLQRREVDRQEMERKILDNIRKLVFSHLDELRSYKLTDNQTKCLDMAVANLRQVTSPFLRNLVARFADFTPREIQVANMVREGKTSKEIANLFNISIRSVEFHRDSIRKKLGLKQKNCNLRVFLMNLSE